MTLANTGDARTLEELAANDPAEYSVKSGELYFTTRLWHEDLQHVGEISYFLKDTP